jgi:rhomboid protease GluP
MPPSLEDSAGRAGMGREPEILPPGPVMPQQPVMRKPRPGWQSAPATYLLVGINCLVFLVMAAKGVSIGAPTTEQLMHWGANNAGSVLVDGEWFRIITAMFVHVGILHLATNMWCLWNLGLLAEPLMGSLGVLAVYLLTGAAGNLLSTDINWLFPIRDGAGGVFFPAGAGASIVLLKSNRLPVPPLELKKLRRSVIYFAALNLVLGLSISGGNLFLHSGLNIDNMAHLGGFTCGLLFAAPMVPRLGSPRSVFNTRLRVAVGMIVGLLVLFAFYINNVTPPAGLSHFLNS